MKRRRFDYLEKWTAKYQTTSKDIRDQKRHFSLHWLFYCWTSSLMWSSSCRKYFWLLDSQSRWFQIKDTNDIQMNLIFEILYENCSYFEQAPHVTRPSSNEMPNFRLSQFLAIFPVLYCMKVIEIFWFSSVFKGK